MCRKDERDFLSAIQLDGSNVLGTGRKPTDIEKVQGRLNDEGKRRDG